MPFAYKTTAEIEAMTEYQREKYFDQKRKHEADEMAAAAKTAAESAVQTAVEAAKTELTGVIDEQKTEITKITERMTEAEAKYEEARTEMNRIKTRETEAQIKGLSAEIHEFFSTESGEKMLKTFTSNKAAFRAELTNINVKAVGVMGVTAGTVAPQFVGPQGIPHEVVQLRNVVPVSPTGSDLVKYVQFTKKDGSIGSVDAGTEKPQIDYNSTPVSAPVIKIAGWLTVQDEFLEDVVGARDFLAEELPKAYMDEETRQGFKGMGAGATPDELSGLYSIWGQDLILPKGTVTLDSNNWDKLAAGLTQVRQNLRASDAIWISPIDYMELLINKGTEMMYTYPITSDTNGTLRIGGVPIYQHTVFEQGEGLAGDYSRGARFFQKKAMTIRTSTEHDVNFTHNLTTILIEARVALACFFPEAFVKINFGTTS